MRRVVGNLALAGMIAGVASACAGGGPKFKDADYATKVYLHAYDKDNGGGSGDKLFFRAPGDGSPSGTLCDLDDREVEYNDRMRSAELFGPPGTVVWLYSDKGCKDGGPEEILEIKVPEGQTSARVNNLNQPDGRVARWIIEQGKEMRGEVSGISWK